MKISSTPTNEALRETLSRKRWGRRRRRMRKKKMWRIANEFWENETLPTWNCVYVCVCVSAQKLYEKETEAETERTSKNRAKNAQFSQITKAISALFDSVVFFSNPKPNHIAIISHLLNTRTLAYPHPPSLYLAHILEIYLADMKF